MGNPVFSRTFPETANRLHRDLRNRRSRLLGHGQEINPLTILLYSIAIGNIVVPVTQRLHRYYSEKPFPYNWLFFVPILLVLLIPVYVLSSVVVWILAPPTPQTLGHLLRTGWKFPVLITFVASVLIFLYQTTKEKLERRNTELQRSVDLGTAQIEMQEQELQRARAIRQSLLPKEIPQLPGFEFCANEQHLLS